MIEMEGLTKRFGDLVAVDGVTLNVYDGEVLALLGPNGAGKTTTVRMLAAILRPTAGRARVAGYDVVAQAREVRRNVGVLTEAPGLYTRMTGREYLDFFARLRGLSAAERAERIAHLADWFEMTGVLDRRIGEYSKGMAQKIALVRTLLHDPPVLLLDEPTSAMDPQSARLVRDTISRMRDDEKRSIIICTHNLPEAEELADRIAIINRGRIVVHGTPSELKRALLGHPLMELRLAQPPHESVVALVGQYAVVVDVGRGWVRYRTASPETTNPRLLRALAQADVPVVTLSEVPQSLEEVYLRALGVGERAVAA